MFKYEVDREMVGYLVTVSVLISTDQQISYSDVAFHCSIFLHPINSSLIS